MNFQEIKLKFRLGILTLRNRFGKIKSTKVIKSNSGLIKSILIFLPHDEKSCRIATYSFQSIFKLEGEGIFYQICIFHDNKSIADGAFNNLQIYKLNEKNGKIILSEDLIKRKKYDMILDLNPSFNLEISECIKSISANYKIGFSSKLSDLFYNIQIDRHHSSFLESDYNRIKSILNIP